MGRWHSEFSSHALGPFTKGKALPYRMDEDDVVVTRVTPREGVTWGGSFKQSRIHLIGELAGAWTPEGRFILGARWLCGASSIGARLYDTERYWTLFGSAYQSSGITDPDEVVCRKCRDARDGVVVRPCVYRLYDKTGQRLLYIGSTKNWEKRRQQHRATTWWWPVVKDVELEHFDSLAEARAAEAAAIRAERPQMNVAHNKGEAS